MAEMRRKNRMMKTEDRWNLVVDAVERLREPTPDIDAALDALLEALDPIQTERSFDRWVKREEGKRRSFVSA